LCTWKNSLPTPKSFSKKRAKRSEQMPKVSSRKKKIRRKEIFFFSRLETLGIFSDLFALFLEKLFGVGKLFFQVHKSDFGFLCANEYLDRILSAPEIFTQKK
jgi:hypothetical protein